MRNDTLSRCTHPLIKQSPLVPPLRNGPGQTTTAVSQTESNLFGFASCLSGNTDCSCRWFSVKKVFHFWGWCAPWVSPGAAAKPLKKGSLKWVTLGHIACQESPSVLSRAVGHVRFMWHHQNRRVGSSNGTFAARHFRKKVLVSSDDCFV